jgi:hypothetical protein
MGAVCGDDEGLMPINFENSFEVVAVGALDPDLGAINLSLGFKQPAQVASGGRS